MQAAWNFMDAARIGRDQEPFLCPTAKCRGLKWAGRRAELACTPPCWPVAGAELLSSACILTEPGSSSLLAVTALGECALLPT